MVNCKTCKKGIGKGSSFHCVRCSLEMHLTGVCTGLSSVAINGINELGVSVVLFWDECMTTHRRDRVLEAINAQNLKDKYQFPNLEAKFEKN